MPVMDCKWCSIRVVKHSEELTRAFIGYITGSPMTQAALIELVGASFRSSTRSYGRNQPCRLADWLLPDAGEELSVLLSHQDVGQHGSQPLDALFGRVLLEHAEEFLLHFGLVAEDLLHLREAQW